MARFPDDDVTSCKGKRLRTTCIVFRCVKVLGSRVTGFKTEGTSEKRL